MYLSRLKLDQKQRETLRALSSPHILHGAVEQSFASRDKRKLWRIDWLNGACYLLVLSEEMPDFSHVVNQFGYPSDDKSWETKDYSYLLSRLQEGEEWHFRLRANPTRSSFKEKDSARGRGKVYAHVTQEQQRKWLLVKADSCGFTLKKDEFDAVHTQWFRFSKGTGGKEVTLRTATFEGKLTISNLEGFRQTLQSGIGRGKAYGCGLLTLASQRG
jgi:CRISPR system Cascade subunit CasE